MKKELKKQIKEDELVTGFEIAASWSRQNWGTLRIVLGVLVVLGIVVGTMVHFQNARQQAAHVEFVAALETFEAPVVDELPADSPKPDGPVFATKEEKLRKAAAAFDGVERGYPTLPEGQWARYYAAIARMEMGDKEGATKGLTALSSDKGKEGLQSALAQMALADLLRSSGALDKAVESYKAIVEQPTFALPRDYALMTMATTLEEAHRLDEAHAAYRRLVDEFPESVYAPDARRRADYLKATAQG